MIRVASMLLVLALAACGQAQSSQSGTPGTFTVHMGGSMSTFGAAASSSH